MKEPVLYIIVPCYNEEEVLLTAADVLHKKLNSLIQNNTISPESKIVLIDDGSEDNTWNIAGNICGQFKEFSAIKLSHNSGHQNAVLAGLMSVRDVCDITITIDADLQDDINVMDEMIEEYQKGNDIVYGVRNNRDSDGFLKRFTAQTYYKFLKFMGVEIVYNHADYRLMDKKALDKLSEFEETNLFLRGLIPLIGLDSSCVYYSRLPRFAGESKYNVGKMFKLAADGVTSFSIKPLKFITRLGLLMLFVSICFLVYIIISKFNGNTQTGWSSLMCSIWFLGGLNLVSLGIVGEYVGKIYSEVKRRPRYIISETKNLNKENTDDKEF